MEVYRQQLATYADALIEWSHAGIGAKSITADWPLANHEHVLCIVAAYWLFVAIGPLLMRLRGPVDITYMKAIYNPLQVMLCSWMVIESARQAYRCENKVAGMTFQPDRADIANVLWVFYITKVLDFFDTFFIILGKKSQQLSFLHIYHHTTIFLVYWLVLRTGYDGDVYITVVLNGFVHMVMYTYYMITSLGLYQPTGKGKAPQGRGEVTLQVKVYSPWWKPFVTYLQMVQFMCMNLQAILILSMGPEWSQYPRNLSMFYLVYIQSLFWLFFMFMRSTYGKKGAAKKSKGSKKSKNN